jgi:hypothetical protein
VRSHHSPAIRTQLKKQDVLFPTDFNLKSRAKPYMNAEIFEEYIRAMLLLNLNDLRSPEGFAGEDAI